MTENDKQPAPQNDELTLNVTGWLHNLLDTPGSVKIDSSQAAYVIQAKEWLRQVNASEMLVSHHNAGDEQVGEENQPPDYANGEEHPESSADQ